MCSEKCVVFKKVNDIVFFITGSGEYTEFICNFFAEAVCVDV